MYKYHSEIKSLFIFCLNMPKAQNHLKIIQEHLQVHHDLYNKIHI